MKKKVEIFTAGCFICNETVAAIEKLATSETEIKVYNLNTDAQGVELAKQYGIKTVPTVVINGVIADCCLNKGVIPEKIKALL